MGCSWQRRRGRGGKKLKNVVGKRLENLGTTEQNFGRGGANGKRALAVRDCIYLVPVYSSKKRNKVTPPNFFHILE